jgi:stage IV sporulation protein FB
LIDIIVMIARKIKINPYLWVIIFLGIVTGYFRQLILLFIIVLIHEMGHVLAAYYYRWRIKKIELLPFGGVAEVEEYGNRPFKEDFIVTIAGPLQHIWMVAFAIVFHHYGVLDQRYYEQFVEFNVMIFTFNLLPIWPLDGGKLLFLLFAKHFPYKQAHRFMLFSSFSFLVIFTSVFGYLFPFHLNLWIIASFLVITHYTEWKQHHFLFMRFLMERFYSTHEHSVKKKTIVADQNKRIKDVLSSFYKGYQHEIVIRNNSTYRKVNEILLLDQMFHHNKFNTQLKDIFNTDG